MGKQFVIYLLCLDVTCLLVNSTQKDLQRDSIILECNERCDLQVKIDFNYFIHVISL